MLNVLKNTEKLRQATGGEKVEGLEPPKNLPDLARDLYERDQRTAPSVSSSTDDNVHTTIQSFAATSNLSNLSRQINEPSKDSVPGLDLSLVRQHLAASQSAIQSVPQPPLQSNYQPVQQPVYQPVQQPVQQHIINPVTQLTSQLLSPSQSFQDNLNAVNDDTGFFKEFEEYVRNNGLNTDIINDLLDKNLLDHMMFYHTTKGEDMPFYASSAELSHAIKVKLEELQNFERSWISNKQKMDLMKKWSSTIESDIHLRSEELKKLMSESRRRGGANNKPAEFFQINNSQKKESSNNSNNVAPNISTNVPLSPTIASSVYRPSSTSISPSVASSTNSLSASSVDVLPKPPVIHPISEQPVMSSKYALNNYVVHDSSKYFYSVDGQVFKSLLDLMNGLDNMSRDAFNHHVTASRNDFANWVKGVFGDFRLSDGLRSQTDREGLWYFLKNNTY